MGLFTSHQLMLQITQVDTPPALAVLRPGGIFVRRERISVHFSRRHETV